MTDLTDNETREQPTGFNLGSSFWLKATLTTEDQPDGGDTWHISKKDFNVYLEETVSLVHQKEIAAQHGSYPYTSIQQHAVYSVPATDLDADPTGNTVTYQECYMLPKAWIDEKAAAQSSGRKDENE